MCGTYRSNIETFLIFLMVNCHDCELSFFLFPFYHYCLNVFNGIFCVLQGNLWKFFRLDGRSNFMQIKTLFPTAFIYQNLNVRCINLLNPWISLTLLGNVIIFPQLILSNYTRFRAWKFVARKSADKFLLFEEICYNFVTLMRIVQLFRYLECSA